MATPRCIPEFVSFTHSKYVMVQRLIMIVLGVNAQVTWVEHVEVDDRSVHNIYKLLVNSGLAFGARRWVGTLDRQCERLASVMASNIPTSDIGGNKLPSLLRAYLLRILNVY